MKKIIYFGVVSGVAMLILSVILGFVFKTVFPNIAAEYNNMSIFRPYSDPLMSLFFLQPFVLGIALAWLWPIVKPAFKGGKLSRGVRLGLIYFVVGTIPGMYATLTSFQLSWQIVLSWTLAGLIEAGAAGIIFAHLDKEV